MGIATLSHGGKSLPFRTNPNSINWTYTLNTKVEETSGGRVIQILSVKMDDLVVTAEAGRGGWDYVEQVGLFMRDMMVNQRSGEAGVFEYPNRGWKFRVYAAAFPFKDSWTDIAKEFTLNFKIQEDVAGIAMSQTIDAELNKLREGIGYTKNEYNTPAGGAPGDDPAGGEPADQAATTGTPAPNLTLPLGALPGGTR